MNVFQPAVAIMGVADELSLCLLPQLHDFSVIGIYVNPPNTQASRTSSVIIMAALAPLQFCLRISNQSHWNEAGSAATHRRHAASAATAVTVNITGRDVENHGIHLVLRADSHTLNEELHEAGDLLSGTAVPGTHGRTGAYRHGYD